MKRYLQFGACIMCMVLMMGAASMAAEGELFFAEGGMFPGTEETASEEDGSGGTQSDDYDTVEKTVGEDTSEENGDSVGGLISGDGIVILPELQTIAMQIPKNLDFVMDPYDLCEKGSIWSKNYVFRNNGETAVWLMFENLKCNLKPGVTAVGAETDDADVAASEEKVAKLLMIMQNGEVLNITEEPGTYQVLLEPGAELSFSIGGLLSERPKESWISGDLSIELMYNVQIAEEIAEDWAYDPSN